VVERSAKKLASVASRGRNGGAYAHVTVGLRACRRMSEHVLERRRRHATVGAAAVIAFFALLVFQAAHAGGAAALPGIAPATVAPLTSAPQAVPRFAPSGPRYRGRGGGGRGFAPGGSDQDFAPRGAQPDLAPDSAQPDLAPDSAQPDLAPDAAPGAGAAS
jgi:hypothetical protein